MKVQELIERIGATQMPTGRILAYIKDGIEELNMLTEVNTKSAKINLEEDKRFYSMPSDMVKMTDIRIKNHLNSKDEYRSIPRMIHKPIVKDEDNV